MTCVSYGYSPGEAPLTLPSQVEVSDNDDGGLKVHVDVVVIVNGDGDVGGR